MNQPPIGSCDVATAAERLGDQQSGAFILDVRERDEFAMLRVPGAGLLPMSELADGLDRVPRGRPLLVMCASGKRSLVAADHLSRHGFTDVTNVAGGIVAWRDAGLPVESGAPHPGEGELPGAGDLPGEGDLPGTGDLPA